MISKSKDWKDHLAKEHTPIRSFLMDEYPQSLSQKLGFSDSLESDVKGKAAQWVTCWKP